VTQQTSRRDFISIAGTTTATAGIAALAGCTGGGDSGDSAGDASEDLDELTYFMTDGEVDIPVFLSGTENGAWEQEGIDLVAELTSYDRYSRSLTSDGGGDVGNVNQAVYNTLTSQGEDIVLFGGNEFATNGVFTRSDSDIESPADFDEDTKVGVPYWNSGTTMFTRSTIKEEYGVDIRTETDSLSADPPVLWELLTEQEDLDAIVEFTLFTIKGMANPDMVDMIFAPQDYWEETRDLPPFVTMFATQREFLEENPENVLGFMHGWDNAIENFGDDLDRYMNQYGRFAGLETDAEVEVVREQFANNNVTIPSSEWGEDYIDSQFEIFELLVEQDVLDSMPPRNAVTYNELEDMV